MRRTLLARLLVISCLGLSSHAIAAERGGGSIAHAAQPEGSLDAISRSGIEDDVDPALTAAFSRHLASTAAFRTKFRTGTYVATRTAMDDRKAASITERIATRLRSFQKTQQSFALVHDFDPTTKRLRAWLFDSSGLIASGATDTAYAGTAPVKSALRVDARAATRAPVKRGQDLSELDTPPLPSGLTPDEALSQLAGYLLPGPIRAALSQRSGRLLVLPSKDSGSAPYAALPLTSSLRLVDRWSVLILPDLPTLLDPQRSFDASRLDFRRSVLVGDPDLSKDPHYSWAPIPGSRAEIGEVAKLLGVSDRNVLTGVDATRAKVLERIDGYGEASLIYFATHGIANSINPMDGSFLALAGGHLTGQDLRSSRLQAWAAHHPLVVLSACQSALGKTFDSGEYGIARAWIAAGAGQVVASLWNVDDRATFELMSIFVDKLTIGMSPEDALQRAQRQASRNYPDDPGAWASFSVMGSPSS